jgi:hypothetical protein
MAALAAQGAGNLCHAPQLCKGDGAAVLWTNGLLPRTAEESDCKRVREARLSADKATLPTLFIVNSVWKQ